MLEKIGADEFYIICPDNDVSVQMDNARMLWNTNDIVESRPALSRWHKDYEAAFKAYMLDIT